APSQTADAPPALPARRPPRTLYAVTHAEPPTRSTPPTATRHPTHHTASTHTRKHSPTRPARTHPKTITTADQTTTATRLNDQPMEFGHHVAPDRSADGIAAPVRELATRRSGSLVTLTLSRS